MTNPATHRRSPRAFFCLVTGLSIPFWVLGAATTTHAQRLPIQLPISALMCVCPGTAALILAYRDHGRAEMHAVLRRAIDAHQLGNRWWYVPILGLMPTVLAGSYGILRLLGRPLPPAHIPWNALPIFGTLFWISALAEELGWTAYVTEPLMRRWGPLNAHLILGIVWAAWHIIPYLQAGRSVGWIGWQCGATVALRVLMGWLYVMTGQRVHTVILFHMMINVSTFAFPIYGSAYDPMVTGLLLSGLALVLSLALPPHPPPC